MNRFARRCLLPLLALAAVASFTTPASATEIVWKRVQLKWSNGALTKSFTAAITDTAFASLPSDIAWDALVLGTSYPIARLDFVTSAAAANADTVHYSVHAGAGGVYPFIDTRDLSPAAGNCAVKINSGLVFSGLVLSAGATYTAGLHVPLSQDARIKVQGDPNGALANLKIFITYPTRATK